MIWLGRIQLVENWVWGDESVPVTRPRFVDRLDWLNLTSFVYLRLSQSSNVSKRLNCLSFQTCKCSSDFGKLSGGTAEALSYVAVLLRQHGLRVRCERCRQRSRRNRISGLEIFSPNCSDLHPSRPLTIR